MALNVIIPQFFLPPESVKLGRFVTSIDEPHQGYHDPPSAEPPKQITSRRESYVGAREEGSNATFGSSLTSLMSAGFSKQAKLQMKITAEQVTTYTLDNSDGWFDSATSLPATRTWIERAIDRGDDIYMIVGFHALTNASIVHESARGSDVDGQVHVPISLSLASVGIVAPLGALIDPSFKASSHGVDNSQSSFQAPGERISAFQYRQIRHKWLSSNKVENLRPAKSARWSSVEKGRAEDDGEDDLIEVETAPVEELDGEWDRQEAPGGEILVLRLEEDDE